MTIVLQRIYENSESNGYRVLVDRVWPRGISKSTANLDDWAKDITPSPTLRKWFNHEPEKFNQFKKEYKKELLEDQIKINKLLELKEILENQNLILLYAAKDKKHNHVLVLKEVLENYKY
ncbi:DUF488 domain-containing protein [Oceanobacillus sp. 1P07AA]|uniref:DUF488 domain-containing protein n=1 Tax=Oceanobacillus sp. 1P07AA TaxID=3132293 RepID=UPI0039A750E8